MATQSKTELMRQRIRDIDATLASGARSITLDGVTVSIDPASLRLERTRLELQLPETRRRRPRAFGVRFYGG